MSAGGKWVKILLPSMPSREEGLGARRDYFQYDNVKHQMLGERSGKRYRLGDRLHVKLVRVDLETGRIDFVLAAPPASMRSPETVLASASYPRVAKEIAEKTVL